MIWFNLSFIHRCSPYSHRTLKAIMQMLSVIIMVGCRSFHWKMSIF